MTASQQYAVVWPRGPRAVSVKPLAQRLESLDGKKVAFLWDYLFRGDEIFPLLEAGLSDRFPGMSFVGYDVFGSTHGAKEREVMEDLPTNLKEMGVDAVVSGLGC
jgi:hypothetical protein